MSEEQIRALCKIAAELPDQLAGAWRQTLVEDGFADPEIGTTPEEVLLEIIHTRIFFRHGKRVTENLFARFGPQPKRAEGKVRKRALAALYGDVGRPPIKRFAKEAAEHNRKARQLRRVQKDQLLGGGATRAESMLQYVRRMLKDEECRKTIEDARANGLFGRPWRSTRASDLGLDKDTPPDRCDGVRLYRKELQG
jgi:hypothetical protein